MATAVDAKEEKFEGFGGLKIHLRSWRPAGKAKAVVAIAPGFNSHSGQYQWVAGQLVGRGYAVYAVDFRGRGLSDGERFFVNSMSEYEDDLAQAIQIAKSREPGLATFLLGHSAGGVVSCIYTLDYQSELAGLICESFAYQTPAPELAIAALKGLSHLAPHARVLHLKNEDFSRDPDRVAMLNADELIEHETQPTKTLAELARADDRLKRNFGQITLPLFILHGSEDHATKPSGSREFHDHAGSKDKTLKIYEGHYHDLLADLGKEEVMGDVIAWLDRHVPA